MHNPKKYTVNYIKNVQPSLRFNEGDDYEEWKIKARTKLSELMGMDKYKKANLDFKITNEIDMGDYKEIYFTYQSEKGYYPIGCFVIPNHLTSPLPLVICLQGHSKGMHISLGKAKYEGDEMQIKNGDRDFAVRVIKEGYIALCIEQRGFGECGGNEKGTQCHIPTMANLLVGRTTIGERVWDVMRAIDVAEQHFAEYIDPNKIICMGNSGGGTTTYYATCMDDRIKYAMPSCSICSYDDSIASISHCTCNFIPHIREYFDMGDLGGLIAPKYMVIVSGKDDDIFPIDASCKTYETIKRFYTMLGKEKNITHIIGNGGHRFYADDAWKAMNKYIKSGE